MRLFATILAGAAAAGARFSASKIIRDAQARDMELDVALHTVAHRLPDSVRELVHKKEYESALIQLGTVHHHRHHRAHAADRGPETTTEAPKDPFTRAIEFLNTELIASKEKVDTITYDCNVFRTEKEQLLLENSNMLTALGSSIAQATATIANAKGTLTTLNTQLAALQSEFDDEKKVCKETLDEMELRLTSLSADLTVASSITQVAEGECVKGKKDEKKPFLIQSCVDAHGRTEMQMEGAIGEALAQFKTAAAREAANAILGDFEGADSEGFALGGELDGETVDAQLKAEEGQPMRELETAAEMQKAEKEYQDEDRLQLQQERTQHASFLQLRQTPGCTTGGKVDCGNLMDKLSQMEGDIRTALDDLKAEHAKSSEDCKTGQAQKETQITDLSQQVAESETILSEATATMLKDTQSQQNAETEKVALEKELADRMAACHTDVADTDSSVCALSKVRNAMFKQVKKSNPLIQDCELSDWIEGECSVTCGAPGTMKVTRTILTEPGEFGAACPPSKLTRECDNGPCPIDCVVSEWAEWSKCTKECGGGVQSHTRQVVTQDAHGGKPCDELSSSRVCNSQACDMDCVLNDWTEFGPCSKPCKPYANSDSGEQFRERHVKAAATGNGKCPQPNDEERLESQKCNEELCPAVMECIADLDMAIMYDGSGSITNRRGGDLDLNFKKEKEFIKELIQNSAMGWDEYTDSALNVRISVSQYSSSVKTLFRLASSKADADKEKMMKLVDDDSFMMGGTATSLALSSARAILQDSTASRHSVVLLMTDGRPNNWAATKQVATNLKNAGIKIVTVPIGPNAAIDEMCEVATAPCSQNMVRADDFDSLRAEINRFVASTCSSVTKGKPHNVSNRLPKGSTMYHGNFLVSKNGKWLFRFHSDGDMCVAKWTGHANKDVHNMQNWQNVRCSGAKHGERLVLQGDFNLVQYRHECWNVRHFWHTERRCETRAKYASDTMNWSAIVALEITDKGQAALVKANGDVDKVIV